MIPVTLGVIALDRITKLIVMYTMEPGDSITVINGYFEMTYVHNTGAAFGMGSSMNEAYRVPFFLVASLLAVGLMIYLARQTDPGEKALLVSLSLIMGGALGNMVDRAVLGHVIDFIDWHIGIRHWPAFNIADSSITVGIAIMAYSILFMKKTEKEADEG